MQLSFREGKACQLPTSRSVAAGLAPQFTGKRCYAHANAFVDGIVTVTDRELVIATKALYGKGLVVEPSGAAAFAALLCGKLPEIRGNVVVVITGGNSTPDELSDLFRTFDA